MQDLERINADRIAKGKPPLSRMSVKKQARRLTERIVAAVLAKPDAPRIRRRRRITRDRGGRFPSRQEKRSRLREMQRPQKAQASV
jgi:hypothetical protein